MTSILTFHISNLREYIQKQLHSPKARLRCGFTAAFHTTLFFVKQCPVNGCKTTAVTLFNTSTRKDRVMFAWKRLVYEFHVYAKLSNFSNCYLGKNYSDIWTRGKSKIISWSCGLLCPLRPPDFASEGIWLSEYLKSRPGASNLSEVKDTIWWEISCIHSNSLKSAIDGFVTWLQYLCKSSSYYVVFSETRVNKG